MRPTLVHKKARRGSGSVQAMRDDCLRAAPADRGGKTRKIVAASAVELHHHLRSPNGPKAEHARVAWRSASSSQ